MARIVFHSPPDGHVFNEPDISMVRELVLYAEGLYWNSGSGDGFIECYDERGNLDTLALFFSPALGFHIQHQNGSNPYFVPSRGSGSDEVVTVFVCGNEEHFPGDSFVPREEAGMRLSTSGRPV